jgi:hypothetical protein
MFYLRNYVFLCYVQKKKAKYFSFCEELNAIAGKEWDKG